jgi:hypothetical protein
MGRSQVLYNRTKARLRAGRGGVRNETGNPSNHQHHRNLHETTPSNVRETESDDAEAKEEHDDVSGMNFESFNEAEIENFKDAEADLLMDMQTAQAYAYASNATLQQQSINQSSGLNLKLLSSGEENGARSALNVSAMAASLNQLSLSRRWKIPRHLAATLVVNGEDKDSEEEEKVVEDVKEVDEVASAIRHSVSNPPVESSAVRVVAATPSVQLELPIVLSCSSESMLAGPEPIESLRINRPEASNQNAPPKVVDSSSADRRRHALLQQRASASPKDLIGDDEQEDEDDTRGDEDDDDVIMRRRRESEGLRGDGDSTAQATAASAAKTYTSTEVVIDCTGVEDDMNQWLDSALESSVHEEAEGQMEDWLDGVIE